VVTIAKAQSNTTFASDEGQRVYDMLDGLGCIGSDNCTTLGDFTPTSACDVNPDHLKCNDEGRLSYL
jgi:hypothetical protein